MCRDDPACLGSPMVFLGSPTILPLTVDPHRALSRVVSRHTELQWWHTREVLVIWNTRTAHVNQLTAWRADTTLLTSSLLWWRRIECMDSGAGGSWGVGTGNER